MKNCLLIIFLVVFKNIANAQNNYYDVVIVGGGAGGTAAALQAARLGAKVAVVEQTDWLGGMLTSAGVSAIDGNNLLAGGIFNQFREQLYAHYKTRNLMSGWVSNTLFEPKVADSILKQLVANQTNITVFYNAYFKKVATNKNTLTAIQFTQNKRNKIIEAKIFIDATETGELLNKANDNFNIGMDSPAQSGDTMAKGPNNILQDLTWVAILKKYSYPALIPKPKNYNAASYYCSCNNAPCLNSKSHPADKLKMLDYGKLPNGSYMLNWPANGNDYYINYYNLKGKALQKAYNNAKQKTLGFIFFIQTQLNLPNIGIDSTAFNTADYLAKIPYYRESRRLQGQQYLNTNSIINLYNYNLYKYGVAVGDYPIDHHHQQNTNAPKINFPKIPAYNIPLGSLQSARYNNLVVCDKNISVSNIVNGATRLQPVCIGTGQAAGALAFAMLSNNGLTKKNGLTRKVQNILLQNKAYIFPTHDVTITNKNFELIQRILITGFMQAIPKAEGWANRMYFYSDSTISYNQLENSLAKNITGMLLKNNINTNKVTLALFYELLNKAGSAMYKTLWRFKATTDVLNINIENFNSPNFNNENLNNANLNNANLNDTSILTRLQVAILLDTYLRPFDFDIEN